MLASLFVLFGFNPVVADIESFLKVLHSFIPIINRLYHKQDKHSQQKDVDISFCYFFHIHLNLFIILPCMQGVVHRVLLFTQGVVPAGRFPGLG
jgi:hypothetical protein